MTATADAAREELDDRIAKRAAAVDRFTASVVHLLDGRADLQGVTPLADHVYAAVRWCA